MTDTFTLRLERIQPSQLYISTEKLGAIMDMLENIGASEIEPIPIKELDGELISTDGHTRMFAMYLRGFQEVEAVWEDIEMDWEAYRIFVAWCKNEGITWIGHLKERVIGPDDYQVLWLDRCRVIDDKLEDKRNQAVDKGLG